jgi:hypothetical protein
VSSPAKAGDPDFFGKLRPSRLDAPLSRGMTGRHFFRLKDASMPCRADAHGDALDLCNCINARHFRGRTRNPAQKISMTSALLKKSAIGTWIALFLASQ